MKLELTPAQIATVNSALGLYEAEADGDGVVAEEFDSGVLRRTRERVWQAMEKAGIDVDGRPVKRKAKP